jgi:mannitol-1-phosphate/altronate dehydrogenase
MLRMIQNFENQNLRNHLREIALGSFEKVQQSIRDPATKGEIQKQAFQAALKGIESGLMKYEQDPLLPLLQSEMQSRIAHFKGLSAEEESKLLSLSSEQRRVIADNDRKAKVDYLGTAPNINNPGIKSHEKYKNFVEMVHNIHKSELKA